MKDFPGIELDEFGGTSWQATLASLDIRNVEQRLGPPHLTDIGGKCPKWWGFRCGDVRFTIYQSTGYASPHVGGKSGESVWFAMALLRMQSALDWRPVDVPPDWVGRILSCGIPKPKDTKETTT